MGSSEQSNKSTFLDDIIDGYGYKWQILKVFFSSIFTFFICGYFLVHSSNYYFVIKTRFNLSDNFQLILNCSIFSIKNLSIFMTGYLLDRNIINRKTTKIFSFSIIILLNIFLIINFSFTSYMIFIFIGVFAIGSLEIITQNVLIESLPMKFRGLFVCFSLIGFSFADLLQNFLVNRFITEKTVQNMNIIFLINSAIIIVFIIFTLCFTSDSARNYLYQGKNEEAFEILNLMRITQLTDTEKNTLIYESNIKRTFNYDKKENGSKGNLIELFKGKYLNITLIFICLIFSFNYTMDGITNTQSIFLKGIDTHSNIKKISERLMIVNLMTLFSFPLAGILIEIRLFKRKMALIIVQILSLIILTIMLIFYKKYFLLGIFSMLINTGCFIIFTFSIETYSTGLRDIAVGFFGMIHCFAGLIGIALSMCMISYKLLIPFYIMFGLIALSLISSIIIGHDTYEKSLDLVLYEKEIGHLIRKKDIDLDLIDNIEKIVLISQDN